MLYPQQNSCRELTRLDGFWNFRPDPDEVGRDKKWQNGIPGGRSIAVPGSYNEIFTPDDFDGLDLMSYQGTVWYEKKFDIPEGISGKRAWLRIGAAYFKASVWLNGHFLGEYAKGFLPCDIEITDHVLAGRVNRLSIAVDNRLNECTIPQCRQTDPLYATNPPSDFDWFPYAGLYRSVYVYWTGANCLRNIKVGTEKRGKDAHVKIQAVCADAWEGRINWSISRNSEELHSGTIKGCETEVVISNADWWSPASPALYRLKLQLVNGQTPIDEYYLDIGLRTIAVDRKNILLNGKPITLRGVAMHEDVIGSGKTLDPVNLTRDFARLRWVGANAIRCTHYPYAEEFYSMADREGFLCFAEVPAWGLNGGCMTSELAQFHKQMIKEMIERDQNHPSIIGWFVANEPYFFSNMSDISSDPPQHFLDYFADICDFTKRLDSRPITIAGCTRRDETYLKMCDIASLNRYFGWYFCQGRIKTGVAKLAEDIEDMHRKLNKPIIVSEFGADGFVGEHSVVPEMHTEEYQAQLLHETIKMLQDNPLVAGQFLWVFADFKVTQSPGRIRNNHKGIFTRDRSPKLAARIVRSLWKKLPLFK
ncbi:MAG: glycoside hydrolase family 2 TIM barrel-domain containing protein [Planctomycetota bacterium]|nr:glycoside hydrolase family 2 TIM barrel-domain containing protein [Planctomycetota bacterium]